MLHKDHLMSCFPDSVRSLVPLISPQWKQLIQHHRELLFDLELACAHAQIIAFAALASVSWMRAASSSSHPRARRTCRDGEYRENPAHLLAVPADRGRGVRAKVRVRVGVCVVCFSHAKEDFKNVSWCFAASETPATCQW